MSDQNTSLPIRTESDGTDQRVHVKIVDGTNPAVNQMSVDADKAAKILATGHNPSGANVSLRLSELGAQTPDGLYNASNNSKPGNVGVVTSTRSATTSDTTQTMRLTGIAGTSGTVNALDMSLHDDSGNPYTNANPLPVSLQESAGGEVHDYADNSAVAANSSSNHDYAVTATKALKLKKVWVSASGKCKVEVQTSPDGTVFTTKFVAFNSTANPNISIDIPSLPVTDGPSTGAKIRLILTNKELTAQDIYSTISGTEY